MMSSMAFTLVLTRALDAATADRLETREGDVVA
jgi:hypothetical protein